MAESNESRIYSALPKDEFFAIKRAQADDLTYDDVRVATGPSLYDVDDVDLTSRFSRSIELKTPFVSAAMDTVTEHKMAITLARLGGIGVIHVGLSPEQQKNEVRRVKYAQSGRIPEPVTITAGRTLQSVLNEIEERGLGFDTFPVVEKGNRRLVGVLTKEGFEYTESLNRKVYKAMVPIEQIIQAPTDTSLETAYKIMLKNRISMLPLTNPDTGEVSGLYIWKDVKRLVKDDASKHNLDGKDRLRTAIAVPTNEGALERVRLAMGDEEFLDVAVIDTSWGDSRYTVPILKLLKEEFPNLDVVVGNVSEPEGAYMLAEAGADGVKVGQGPGSICTTRMEIGIGAPQVTAIYNCVEAVRGMDVPICADGGIQYFGDLNVAIAVGADSIMMGGMFAATAESPGIKYRNAQGIEVKGYRGMASRSAILEKGDPRGYRHRTDTVLLPQGVEKEIPFKGSVEEIFKLAETALKDGIVKGRSGSVRDHRQNARFRSHGNAAQQESRPHDVLDITN